MPAPGPRAGSHVPEMSRTGAGPAVFPPASGSLTGLPHPSTTVKSAVDRARFPPPSPLAPLGVLGRCPLPPPLPCASPTADASTITATNTYHRFIGPCLRASEIVLDAELHDTRRIATVVRTGHRRDAAERAHVEIRHRVAPVEVIQQVERLH